VVGVAVVLCVGGLLVAAPAWASDLYVSNGSSDTVSPFAIAADGSLSPVTCPGSDCITGGDPAGVAMSPNGQFLYAVNRVSHKVSVFAIAADGSPSPVSCAGSNCNTGSNPIGVAVSPNGQFLYTTNENSATVSVFAIGADGSLSPVSCSGSNCSTGTQPGGVAVSPNGQFLYTANGGSSTVSVFAIAADGSLSPVTCSGSNCSTGMQPVGVAVSPNGQFLYTTSFNSDTVSVFAIAADGSLSPVTCSGSNCSTGSSPFALAVSPNGQFLYTTSFNSGTVSVFAIAADGSLSPVTCSGSNCDTGTHPQFQSVAITPDQAPTAAFTASRAPAGSASSLDGSASSAAAGQHVARYDWDYGDGTTATNGGPTPTHTYATAGNYTVTLTVTDDAGCSTSQVFTGQTASCNGSQAARTTHTITIPALPTARIASPDGGGTYTVGQSVATSFSCAEGTGGPGLASCDDNNGASTSSGGSAHLATSTVGRHTYTVTATSGDGGTASASISYTVAGAPTVSISTPASGARYTRGQRVRAGYSCQDGPSGPGISTCAGTVATGTPIDTSKPGKHTFTVMARSLDGQLTARAVSYTVALPNNKLVPVRRKPHSDGTFIVTVKLPGPGSVDILITAWKDNLAIGAAVLQPAKGRFVFARAHATATRAGILRIVVRPNARGRRLVAHHRYRVTLRLWISYTPTHGRQRDIGYYGLHLP
jgi:6-phosphogluconolactonase (cycloisomerase 2 family)